MLCCKNGVVRIIFKVFVRKSSENVGRFLKIIGLLFFGPLKLDQFKNSSFKFKLLLASSLYLFWFSTLKNILCYPKCAKFNLILLIVYFVIITIIIVIT